MSTLKAKPKQPGSTPLATGHCPLATNPKRVISPASGALPAPGEGSFRRLAPRDIIERVCSGLGVRVSDVLRPGNRGRSIRIARDAAIRELHLSLPHLSTQEIATAMGLASHSSVLKSMKRTGLQISHRCPQCKKTFTTESAESRGGNHV